MQEADGRTFSFSPLSSFPFGPLGYKLQCWVFVNGVDFQDAFGGRQLQNGGCVHSLSGASPVSAPDSYFLLLHFCSFYN